MQYPFQLLTTVTIGMVTGRRGCQVLIVTVGGAFPALQAIKIAA
jgi:hypothetical protein